MNKIQLLQPWMSTTKFQLITYKKKVKKLKTLVIAHFKFIFQLLWPNALLAAVKKDTWNRNTSIRRCGITVIG